MRWFSIVLLAVVACIVYGIVHDQITARICVEYFTIGHAIIIPTEDPTILGLLWGVIATWWVGVMLGVPLACVARWGSQPRKTASELVRPMGLLMLVNGIFALCAGTVGYLLARNDWVYLTGPIAERVPEDRHVTFLTDLWAHNASYLGGFIGGILLMIWVWRSRRVASNSDQVE